MQATQVELGFSWTSSDFTTWYTLFWRRKQKGKFGLLISEAVTNMFISLSLFWIECRRLCDNLSFDISAVAISLSHSIRTYEVMLRRDLKVAIRYFNMTIGSFNTLGLAFKTWVLTVRLKVLMPIIVSDFRFSRSPRIYTVRFSMACLGCKNYILQHTGAACESQS